MSSKKILIVGRSGRMSLELQKLFSELHIGFDIWKLSDPLPPLQDTVGMIDFTTPEVSLKVIQQLTQNPLPYVCGTTGWASITERDSALLQLSKKAPLVVDSNFSRGIELMSQVAEDWAQKIQAPWKLIDIHHRHKKDAPSGTALKIKARMERSWKKLEKSGELQIESIREDEVPGVHRLVVNFEGQTLELIHTSHSRRPFAAGAYQALQWIQNKKSGFYSMEDILK